MALMEHDALLIHDLLPWVGTVEDVLSFMVKIPPEQEDIRNQLTLLHFFRIKDRTYDFVDETEIQQDTAHIIRLLNNYKGINKTKRKKIEVMVRNIGNIPNRVEVVLRQLLFKKEYLNKVLEEMPVVQGLKRKINDYNEHLDIDLGKDEVMECNETIVHSPAKKIQVEENNEVHDDTDFFLQENPIGITELNTLSANTETEVKQKGPPETKEDDLGFDEFLLMLEEEEKEKEKVPELDMSQRAVTSNIPVYHRKLKPPTLNPVPTSTQRSVPNIDNYNLPSTSRTSPRNLPVNNFIQLRQSIVSVESDSDDEVYARPDNLKLRIVKHNEGFWVDNGEDKKNKATVNVKADLNKNMIRLGHNLNDYKKVTGDRNKNSIRVDRALNFDKITAERNKNLIRARQIFNDYKKVSGVKNKHLIGPGQVLERKEVTGDRNENLIRPAKLLAKKDDLKVVERPKVNDNTAQRPTTSRFADHLENYRREMNAPSSLSSNDEDNVAGANGIGLFINQVTKNLLWKQDKINLPTPETVEAGPSTSPPPKKKRVVDEKLFLKLIEIFPDACPEYINKFCEGQESSALEQIVGEILTEDYPKRPMRAKTPEKEVDFEDQLNILKEVLPDADPTFLRIQCERYANDSKGLKEFIDNAIESPNYPTMKEYLRKEQLSSQQKQYTTNFKVENFVQLFPDPVATFNDPERKLKLNVLDKHYVNQVFRNKYTRVSIKNIALILDKNKFKLLATDKDLEEFMEKSYVRMKTKRKILPLPTNIQNIPLLQEIAFLTHRQEIEDFIKNKLEQEEKDRIEAKQNGLMSECKCCYDNEIMPKDVFTCPNQCTFCRNCVKRYCEITMGEGKTDYYCLAECKMEFSLQTLQMALPPKMFSTLANKKALAEVKAAGIEELEMCPFCDFASIPNAADKIYRCLNPDCMKESCRLCKEPNHLPLRCDEVEKDEDVKARVFVENQMTEALLRKCWKCGTSFFKEEGCNKMTCSCGASMCYVCKSPVTDYKHFNGIGGTNFELCPLYSDTNKLNHENVKKAAAAAKANIDPEKLKVDPSADLENHYQQRKKKLPAEPHVALMQEAQNFQRNLHQLMRFYADQI